EPEPMITMSCLSAIALSPACFLNMAVSGRRAVGAYVNDSCLVPTGKDVLSSGRNTRCEKNKRLDTCARIPNGKHAHPEKIAPLLRAGRGISGRGCGDRRK